MQCIKYNAFNAYVYSLHPALNCRPIFQQGRALKILFLKGQDTRSSQLYRALACSSVSQMWIFDFRIVGFWQYIAKMETGRVKIALT